MLDIEMIILMLGIIALVGVLTRHSIYPLSLYLVIVGIILSPVLEYPLIEMHPEMVLYVFLPMLIYAISTQFSLTEFKQNLRPILLLSIGHVLFITALIASLLHYFIPGLGWPLAFVIGSVVSPPDDVAIANIAEKVKLPSRIVNILEGEGMLNDAAALILFRFSLIALITHQFSPVMASFQFVAIVICETLYGIVIANLIGKARTYIKDPIIHITVSLLTPFLAYLPAEQLGGCGVISTAVTGIIIGNFYAEKFTYQFRLLSMSVWPTISYVIQNFLFLLVGINIDTIYKAISVIPMNDLVKFTTIVVLGVIIGRFIWVYPQAYIPRWLFPHVRRNEPTLPWQYPLIVSWAGMRGGISLAAALIVPNLPVFVDNVNARDLVTFLAFAVIFATLILQGLSLPWLIRKTGVCRHTRNEAHQETSSEIRTRLIMTEAAIDWLNHYMTEASAKENNLLLEEIVMHLNNYEKLKQNLSLRLTHYQGAEITEEYSVTDEINLSHQTVEIEKEILIRLWHEEKISLRVRNKLLQELDYRTKSALD